MGSAASKTTPPSPTVQPRDADRVAAAGSHVHPIVEQLAALNDKIDGDVLLPGGAMDDDNDDNANGDDENGDDAYHTQRERPFYLNDANYPSAIILVATIQDVSHAIQFVASLDADDREQYKLCIAGGCHSAYGMVEHAIVLDVSRLNCCEVNVEKRVMTVGGGSKICEAHDALKGTGLGFATGTNGDTGVSGLTMAGGAGYLGGRAGYGCDTVVAAQVVLPTSGELVTATDENEYADLLRALRGGGGNFGIVVEWSFTLFDVSNAMGGTIVHMCPTVGSLTKVLTKYAEVLKGSEKSSIPEEANSICAIPAGAPVFVNVCTVIGDSVQDITAATDVPFFHQISNLGAWFRISNDVRRRDYITEISILLEPVQQRTYGMALGAMIYAFDESIRNAVIHYTRVEYPKKNVRPTIIIMHLHGKMRDNDDDGGAASQKSSLRHRKAEAWIILNAEWEPYATPDEIHSVQEWARQCKAKLIELGGEDGPHNFCDTDGRRIKFFTEEQRAFLKGAKEKYDPMNVLTLNKNILSHAE